MERKKKGKEEGEMDGERGREKEREKRKVKEDGQGKGMGKVKGEIKEEERRNVGGAGRGGNCGIEGEGNRKGNWKARGRRWERGRDMEGEWKGAGVEGRGRERGEDR